MRAHPAENLTIRHRVKDYPRRTGYDESEKGRVAAGVTNGRVFRGAEDPNDVVILVADMGRARAWFTGEDLKAAMQKGGVVGPTSYHFSF